MLWWFLILGISAAVVVLVAVSIFVQIRKQMKAAASGTMPESGGHDESPSPPAP